jgi:hypothetical protein
MKRHLVAVVVALVATGKSAHGYDPATTHAGLTERSVLASELHRVLARNLARPLGVFEPVVLAPGVLAAPEGRPLAARLATLDPSAGYSPGADGAASALAWVMAGAVIAGTPAERGQHLFYDPSRGSGLSQPGGVASLGNTFAQLFDTRGGLRAFFTGTAFNLTGRPSTEWLMAPENDVGLPVFYSQLDAAIAGAEPAQRATALARALLALGGTLAVLQEAGEPAHVRNDFRRSYLGNVGPSPLDRGSAFERFVAESYGRMGVPPAGAPVKRPTVMAFITAADAQGLADRTQRRFFSDGSLPEDAVIDADTTTAEVMRDTRASLPYALPTVPRLELRELGVRRYALTADRRRRLFVYERVPGRVRFQMDEAVYADTARVLLPEIAAYGAGLIDHLFRATVALEIADGAATISISGAQGGVRKGEIRVFGDDEGGARRALGTVPAAGGSLAIPAGTKRVAAVLRGEDDAGELVAVGERVVR